MTVTALTPPSTPAAASVARCRPRLCDVLVLTGRNLVHIAREPLQLSDVTVQPVLFTLLFVYVFGAGVVLPGGGTYADFAIAGLLALNLTTSSMGTAVGLEHRPQQRGDRPVPDAAHVAAGRARRPLARRPAHRRGLCAAIVAITGLCLGWRPTGGVVSIAAPCRPRWPPTGNGPASTRHPGGAQECSDAATRRGRRPACSRAGLPSSAPSVPAEP